MDFSNFRRRIPKVTVRWTRPGLTWEKILPGRDVVTVIVIVANTFILITGLVFLTLGMTCLFLQNLLSGIPLLNQIYWYSGQLLTTCCCILAVAILGYVATWKRSRYAQGVYASVLTVVVVCQLCMVVQSSARNMSVQEVTAGWVTSAYQNPVLRLPFHLVEISMRCCGAAGAIDYMPQHVMNVHFMNLHVMNLPATCCNLHETCTADNVFSGCTGTISKYVQKISYIAGGLTYFAVGTEIILVLASLHLIYIWSFTRITLPKLIV